MTAANDEKVWSTVQIMEPFDVLMSGKSEEHRRWYRIPSWRVQFDVDALRGIDVRLHKSLDGPHSWALSEGGTGHKMYEGFDPTDDEPGTSTDVLHEFVALVLPRLTREIVEASIAKARELLLTLPPCPFVVTEELRTSGWSIRHVDGRWRTMDTIGMPDWTDDASEALSFRLRKHADTFSSDDPDDVRIVPSEGKSEERCR